MKKPDIKKIAKTWWMVAVLFILFVANLAAIRYSAIPLLNMIACGFLFIGAVYNAYVTGRIQYLEKMRGEYAKIL